MLFKSIVYLICRKLTTIIFAKIKALAKVLQEPGSGFRVQSSGVTDSILIYLYSACYNLSFASHKFAADARRERCRCISIPRVTRGKLQIYHARSVTVHNEADAEKSCDFFSANKSSFCTICIKPIWFPPVRIRHYGKNITMPNMSQVPAYQFFSHKVCFCLCKIEV